MKLNKYSASTGEFVKTLFEEKHEKYVEADHPLTFLKSNPDQFIWWSERDGYNHLYLYSTEGDLIRQITKGDWMVLDILGFDAKEKNIFISSTNPSPLDEHIYKVNMKSGKMMKLTAESGVHHAELHPSGNYIIDTWSRLDKANVIDIVSTKNGKVVRNLIDSKNPHADLKKTEIEFVELTAADGKTKLYGRLIKPADFDPAKKYPTIVYVYGGPHAQLVKNSWLGAVRGWQIYMAQHGYVMFTLDNRGSGHRGLEFENCIHRQCGVEEEKDQMKGIEYLKSLPFVDADRIGVHGWSYGGFMTTSLMLDHADVFKVGVAGGPVIDWKYYEVMYGERYMDTPQENPEGYESASLLNKAGKLEGKLLIIHGAIDPVVVWQNSMMFIQKCIENGKQVDYFVYPRSEHNVLGWDRIHLMEKVSMYFDDYLK